MSFWDKLKEGLKSPEDKAQLTDLEKERADLNQEAYKYTSTPDKMDKVYANTEEFLRKKYGSQYVAPRSSRFGKLMK